MVNNVLQAVIYLIISFAATTAGALTGMGGGVIIKPVLDMLGDYDIRSISMLSSITVFSMATVSIMGQRNSGNRADGKISIPLAVGAVAGGLMGDQLMRRLAINLSGNIVTAVQNTVLALLIIGVFSYMRKKDALPKLEWNGVAAAGATGVILGFLSSFLGIGGGPINVALIIFVFNYDTKSAAACSLVTIWFSQAAKIITAAVSGGFGQYTLTMLPVMVIGAVFGGFLGRRFQKKLTGKAVDKAFNGMQAIIFILCVWNIAKNV